jgi:predicted phage-related endonuclease
MTRPVHIYEEIAKATNNTDLARVIAEAFEEADDRYPGLSEVATKTALSETELKLIKEIEGVRLEITEVESRLKLEIKEVESRLKLEIKEVESRLKLEIKEVELRLIDKMNSQATKIVAILTGYITFVAALFKIFS